MQKNISNSSLNLLSRLLENGGFCTAELTANFLEIDTTTARKHLAELQAFGLVRRVFLLRAHDATLYFQITRRAGKMLGKAHPNAARSSPTDSQILRGLARFWLSVQPAYRERIWGESISFGLLTSAGLDIPVGWPTGDTVVQADDKTIEIWTFPAAKQSLDIAVKSAFLRYADQIDRLKIGFVIEHSRASDLQKILDEIAGIDTKTGQDSARIQDEITRLQAHFDAAAAVEKVRIHAEITRLTAQIPAEKDKEISPLARCILPVLAHDLY